MSEVPLYGGEGVRPQIVRDFGLYIIVIGQTGQSGASLLRGGCRALLGPGADLSPYLRLIDFHNTQL